MFKELFYFQRLFLKHPQMRNRLLLQLHPRPRRLALKHPSLEIVIQILIRVQLRAIRRQIENLNLLFVLLQPLLDRLAIMNSQIVQDQNTLRPASFTNRPRNLIINPAFIACRYTINRICPWLVMVEIKPKFSRRTQTRTTGVCPCGA